jgi:hypothetical protein
MKLNWQPEGTVLVTHTAHVQQILDRYKLHHCRLRTLPLQPGAVLIAEGEKLDTIVYPFASLIGGLLYIS